MSSLQEIKLEELCNSIMLTSKKIESIVIVNKLGRPVKSVMRKGNPNLPLEQKDEIFFMQCVLQMSMGKEHDSEYGPLDYHLSERKNLTMIAFPLHDHVVLAKIKKNVSPIPLAKKIVTIISDHT